MTQTSPVTIATFLLYILGVFVLAGFSHRLLTTKSFLGEYFLGSRGLGSWALAFTFAATSASGGSFTGYPSLIYTHGWILAFWIASYMVVPICTMGVMGKRLNQVARKTGAITIPDVLRDRYESTALGLFATCTIIFFTVSNLVAQFKAGAIIIQKTFNLPDDWGSIGDQTWAYIVGLLVFAGVVVVYTAYGGFRAVVWTDVMQGVVMGVGVVILLPVILNAAGGLGEVNRKIRETAPLVVTSVPGENNDLVFLLNEAAREKPPTGVEYRFLRNADETPSVTLAHDEERGDFIQVRLPLDGEGTTIPPIRFSLPWADGDGLNKGELPDWVREGFQGNAVALPGENAASPPTTDLLTIVTRVAGREWLLSEKQNYRSYLLRHDDNELHVSAAGAAEHVRQMVLDDPQIGALLVDVKHAYDNDGSGTWKRDPTDKEMLRWDFIYGDEFLFGPGRRSNGAPFHPLGMAISFFFMWAISGMGQPGTMVRLIAFEDSRTLKRAIMTVTVYYALIYLPLVFIFVTARTLLLGPDGTPTYLPQEVSDNAMVYVATRVVADMGFIYAVLAAIFVAAPFAAVMSTVDSFLLMISSALVRDVYQRTINPHVSDRVVKWASYTTTAVVGIIVTLLATQRIDFLQYIIVFTGGGFAATFLFPVFLGIYWRGMTRQGALCSMIGGFATVVGLFTPTMFSSQRVDLFGFHPVFWGLAVSALMGIGVSRLTGPAPEHLLDRYFRRRLPS